MAVDGELVPAGCNAPPVLEAKEGALDDVAGAMGAAVERVFRFARGIVGNDRRRAAIDQGFSQRVPVVGGAGEADLAGEAGRRSGGYGRVATTNGPKDQPERPPSLVHAGVDLGGSPPRRPASESLRSPRGAGPFDRLRFGPRFPPARGAMRFHMRRIDDHLRRRTAVLGETGEHVLLDAFRSPADAAILRPLARPAADPRVASAAAGARNVDDAAHRPPVIHARHAAGVIGQRQRQPGELSLCQPKAVRGHEASGKGP
ncbi:MAG: hypothetical protein AAF676_13280 [Pseudomonadota bacterium]